MAARTQQLVQQLRPSARVRPTIHITAPHWINDPCAPSYDQSTKTYHLFYQCNTKDCAWADIQWDHVTSQDLLSWHRVSTEPALKPDRDYDQAGVFTGCSIPPTTESNSHELAVAYSSVRALPFHWSTPPYPRNVAGIALAISTDGGKSWQKSPRNPILTGEPEQLEVSGFRDPYVSEWPGLSRLRGEAEDTLYAIVSGGIHDVGPTSFLYQITRTDVTSWNYLYPLVDLPLRFQPSKKWGGNFGVNWECTNFMTLSSGSTSRNFLIVCPEGDVERDQIKNHTLPKGLPPRTVRQQLWMSGDLVKSGPRVTLQYRCGSFLDHGTYYAANSFFDIRSGRRIVHGWIPEEDCSIDFARQKGWNGAIAIPREVFLLSIPNVVEASQSSLADITCVECEGQPNGTITLHTLGVKPIDEVASWRENCVAFIKIDGSLVLPSDLILQKHLFTTLMPTWELSATITVSSECESVGFIIRHTDDFRRCCKIGLYPQHEFIKVDRSLSTSRPDVNLCPEMGPFTLFTIKEEQELIQEKWHLRIFSDGDILEVFANDRFAMATMVYSDAYDTRYGGISAFASGPEGSAMFEDIRLWDGLKGMRSIVVDSR